MIEEDDLSLSSDSDTGLPQDDQENVQNRAGVKTEKRQYHNLLERNRRNILKFSFGNLRSVIPSLAKKNSRQASRAKILRKAIGFIRHSELKRLARERDIKDLRSQNKIIEEQIKAMESALSVKPQPANRGPVKDLLQEVTDVEFKKITEESSSDSEVDEDTSDEVENDPGDTTNDSDSPQQENISSEEDEIDVVATEPQMMWSPSATESESESDDSSGSD